MTENIITTYILWQKLDLLWEKLLPPKNKISRLALACLVNFTRGIKVIQDIQLSIHYDYYNNLIQFIVPHGVQWSPMC